jgi:hypothetical protein
MALSALSSLSVLSGLGLALVASCGLFSCGARVERRTPSRSFVETTLPASENEVLARVHTLFRNGLAQPPAPSQPTADRFAHFVLFPRRVPPGHGFVSLPDDFDLLHNTRDDPAVERYLRLPADLRAKDLFLYRSSDLFWNSEYETAGRPLPLTCHFILHFEPMGPHRSRVEVLEYQPLVRAGRRLGAAAHGIGIGWMDELRLVPPTTRDRLEILARIQSLFSARSE